MGDLYKNNHSQFEAHIGSVESLSFDYITGQINKDEFESRLRPIKAALEESSFTAFISCPQ